MNTFKIFERFYQDQVDYKVLIEKICFLDCNNDAIFGILHSSELIEAMNCS